MPTSAVEKLRGLTALRRLPWVERFWQSAWPARAQRFGSETLDRLSSRFPALSALLSRGNQRVQALWTARTMKAARDGEAAVSTDPASALSTGLEASSWQARVRCVERWGSLPCEASIPLLRDTLYDESVEVAIAAALALGDQQSGPALEALRTVVENREGYFSPLTRAAAVQSLGRLASTLELLPVQRAVSDADAEVSLAAIGALSERAPHEAGPTLVSVLRDASGYFLPPVRVAAARALVLSGGADEEQLQILRAGEVDPQVLAALEPPPLH